jgi:hypothetical protein
VKRRFLWKKRKKGLAAESKVLKSKAKAKKVLNCKNEILKAHSRRLLP